jgi:hypothetical protein
MCSFTPSAAASPPDIDPKTAAALHELISKAAKRFLDYDGPIEVEIIPDADSRISTYAADEEFFYSTQQVSGI